MLLYSVSCVVVSCTGARERVKFDAKIPASRGDKVYDAVLRYLDRAVLCRGERADNIKLELMGAI